MLLATKIIDHHSKFNNFKTDSTFTIVAKLFFICKNLYFANDEVRVGYPKLGHTALINTFGDRREIELLKKKFSQAERDWNQVAYPKFGHPD